MRLIPNIITSRLNSRRMEFCEWNSLVIFPLAVKGKCLLLEKLRKNVAHIKYSASMTTVLLRQPDGIRCCCYSSFSVDKSQNNLKCYLISFLSFLQQRTTLCSRISREVRGVHELEICFKKKKEICFIFTFNILQDSIIRKLN